MGTQHSVAVDYSVPSYSIISVQIFLITIAVAGRTISRRLMKAKTSIDDCLTYLAYVANLGLLIAGLLLTFSGALSLKDVSAQSAGKRRFANDAFCTLAVLYVFSVTFIKLSMLFFYRRIFTMFEKWFRWAWRATLCLVLAWAITCIVLIALETTGTMPKSGFSRLGISTTGIVNGFSDVVLMVLPAVMISKMKLQKKQKIAIIGIFMIGGIAASVSVVRGAVFFSNRRHQLNKAYSNYLDIILTATEVSAGLMCACLPLTKPLVVHISKWIQRMRGLNTDHQGWTTNPTPENDTGNEKDKTILRVDDYHVELLPASQSSGSQSSGSQSSGSQSGGSRSISPQSCSSQSPFDGREAIGSENPWQKL